MTVTYFAGIEFPTALHAAWAFFLDDLLVPWRFRPASFRLASGRDYEPDFWLPRHQFWFQVGPNEWDEQEFRDWQEFAAAADASPCEAHERFVLDMRCGTHHAPHAIPLLPDEWQAREVLFTFGGIPDPDMMTSSGPADWAHRESMYTARDNHYQWTRCATCGTVGAGHAGIAEHLPGDHDDPEQALACADDPFTLSAYRLARRAIAAQLSGSCARCEIPFKLGDLVLAGRKVGRRRWYHADCLLASLRERKKPFPNGSDIPACRPIADWGSLSAGNIGGTDVARDSAA